MRGWQSAGTIGGQCVSIPKGAIMSASVHSVEFGAKLFQFQKVRL